MKSIRHESRPGRHEERMQPLREDSYRVDAKIHEPASCTGCAATYRAGRWTWEPPAQNAQRRLCPACERVRDAMPAGYVTLKGGFVRAHRDELVALVRGCEAREKSEHPLQRLMKIEDMATGIRVTTTDGHLARGIATALHDAYKGTVRVRFARQENVVRAVWERNE